MIANKAVTGRGGEQVLPTKPQVLSGFMRGKSARGKNTKFIAIMVQLQQMYAMSIGHAGVRMAKIRHHNLRPKARRGK
jgi:hypothetical protein